MCAENTQDVLTGDLVFQGNPPFNVIQSFVNNKDKGVITLNIRRWDREYVNGWKSPYKLTILERESSQKVAELEVPANRSAELKINVRINRDVPTTKPLRGKIPMNFFQTSGAKFRDGGGDSVPQNRSGDSVPQNRGGDPEDYRSCYEGVLGNTHRINTLLQHNFKYKCLNDKQANREIKLSGWPDLIEAYDSVRSTSYKADLLRYYLLYKYGGIYTDDKSLFRYPLDSDVFGKVFNDPGCDGALIVVESCLNPEIAFLASKKGSRLIKGVLELAISNINKRFYAESPFEITGNKCFQEVLKRCARPLVPHSESNDNWECHWYDCMGEKYYFFPRKFHHETLLVQGDLKWIQFIVPWSQTSKWTDPNYYVNLNFRRLVYKDRNDEYPQTYSVRKILFPSCQFAYAFIALVTIFLIFVIRTII